MQKFGTLKRVNLREVWIDEARDFTPWLADNLEALGKVLGVDLDLTEKEASVGSFYLDILAKDLGSGKNVIIENQLAPADHTHLGQIITYAAGYEAETVVWICSSLRDEHRKAMEWLNEKTDESTQFFAVVVELLTIGDSLPAYNFKLEVAPNTWQKQTLKSGPSPTLKSGSSPKPPRQQAYQVFFQKLVDEMREQHHYTNSRKAYPQNWVAFSSGTISGILFSATFAHGKRHNVEVYIDTGPDSGNRSKEIFAALFEQKEAIEQELGYQLEWQPLENRRACRIAIYQDGDIFSSEVRLQEIHNWMVARLLEIRKVFTPRLEEIA